LAQLPLEQVQLCPPFETLVPDVYVAQLPVAYADQQPVVPLEPQTFAVPPPPHVPELQLPQFSVPPQPSGIEPQFLPCRAHVVGVQPQTLAVPPPAHVCGAVQEPQARELPQPSGIEPQFLPWAEHDVGMQVPQTLAVPPPPQVWGATHVFPQLRVPPQPSGMPEPHCVGFDAEHVAGTQEEAQTLLLPQVWPDPQVPQLRVLPQPSGIEPQFFPWAEHVVGVQAPPDTAMLTSFATQPPP
jgi:hypothetical protein